MIADASAEKESSGEVVPLFKLIPGTSCGSFGFACALASGIPRDVVQRGRRIAQAIENGEMISSILDNSKESLHAHDVLLVLPNQ